MGIEPTLSAWEAEVLPLNYTRKRSEGRVVLKIHRPPILLCASWLLKSQLLSLCLTKLHFCLSILLLALLMVACTPPISMRKIPPDQAFRDSYQSPLSGDLLSDAARSVLRRYDLESGFEDNPGQALHQLHLHALKDDRRDTLFALAELNYSWAKALPEERTSGEQGPSSREVFLQASVYAFLYLLGPGKEPPPSAFDGRFREACEIYNRSLDLAFRSGNDESLIFQSGANRLPEFNLNIELQTNRLRWKVNDFESFHSADAYEIEGFSVRNRNPGLGAPIIGVTAASVKSPNGGALPITAFLEIEGPIPELDREVSAKLDLISSFDEHEITVNGHLVPLQSDSTAPIAYRLKDSDLWSAGLRHFLFGEKIGEDFLLIQPYQVGRIPVVLVHGTGSSPVWWAEMVNTLRSDDLIRKNYQFWFYEYASNMPVPASAAEMRKALTDMVHQLDPQKKDPALNQMVLIGHSQGGLLAHMTAVDSGNRLWESISEKPFHSLVADSFIKDGFRRAMFFDHLPFVRRIIFIATPHRGSFLTQGWVRKLAHNLWTMPKQMISDLSARWQGLASQLKLPESMKGDVPTAVDGMSSDNPVMQELLNIPFSKGVSAHSIIPVLPEMEVKTGNDGVVEYSSAHMDGVESELVVRSGHSVQSHPLAIEEVRRILRLHCEENPPICKLSKP